MSKKVRGARGSPSKGRRDRSSQRDPVTPAPGEAESRLLQLDSLRAIACLCVLTAHLDSVYGFPELPEELGPVGVAIFFALSGFLITRSLISGPIDLWRFFNRRALRILPAYFLLLSIVSLFWYGKEVVWCATFTFNFLFITGARDYFHIAPTGTPSPPVGHLWSICVEEHYYWVWPFILLVCNRRVASILLATIVFATPAIAWWIIEALDARGVHPDVFAGVVSRITVTQLTAIALGSLVALHEAPLLRMVSLFVCRVSVVALLGFIAVCICLPIRHAFQTERWGTPEQQLCFQPTLIHVFASGVMCVGLALRWLGQLTWLRYLGRISYGLYLYHLPIYVAFGLAQTGTTQIWPVGVAAVSCSLLAAIVSFEFFEAPLIEWGKRRQAAEPNVRHRLGVAVAGMLALLCIGTLSYYRSYQPLSSLLNLTGKIPLEERRHVLEPVGTAITGYRWLGVDHYADGRGFRRTTEIPPKRSDTLRIITVGDSFTWGACVRENKTFSAQLEQRLRARGLPVEVINCGKSGGQAEDAQQTIEKELLVYEPDKILYAATMTDFLPSNTGWGGHRIAEWTLPENQQRFITAVQGMKEFCDRERIDFSMFVFYQNPSNAEGAKIVRLIEQLGTKAGAEVISVESYLQMHRNRDFRIYDPLDDHPTEECHRLHAELLAEKLFEH